MSDPTPVSQQIADAILAALQTIGTAGGDAETPEVEEASSLGNIPTDKKFVLVEVDGENTDDAPEQAIEYETNYVLCVFVQEPPSSGFSPRTRARTLRSDVIKKLMATYQWGGLAVDTKVRGWEWIDNAADYGASDGLMLRFAVQHRENLYDPYQPR